MIIGTAGHIDHGKSALVTALTGLPVDRLAEEQRRGITIDLNFAPLEFPGLPAAGIIDVPGHEDFVRTMVAGASGIDLALLVIDLVEGPRPQTEEHLTILEQLRISQGIPVFTKADLVDSEWAELVIADLHDRLAASPIAWLEPAVVSAVTGRGVAELRERLRGVIASRPNVAAGAGEPFRMPVDRVFSVAGIGTIVTGTTWSGTVSVGDQVTLLPGRQPGRVRSIEAYGRPRQAAEPGVRTALGLVGVERADVRRGTDVVTGDWEESSAIDAVVSLVTSAPKPLLARTRVRVHLGTAEVLARIQPRTTIRPGESGLARLVLEGPVVARGGDRFVLRSFSPVTTIGGGRVVDPLPPRRATWPEGLGSLTAAARLAALAERRPFGVEARRLPQLAGPSAEPVARAAGLSLVAERWIAESVGTELGARLVELVKRHHAAAPTEPGLSLETLRRATAAPPGLAEHALDQLIRRGLVSLKNGQVALNGFAPRLVGGEEGLRRLVAAVEAAGLEAPTVVELAATLNVPSAASLVREAVAAGSIVFIDRERVASAAAIGRLRAALLELGAQGDISPAAVRDRLGVSRKYLIPLLEWADRQGLTRRVGDVRVLIQTGR
jgi:selenocysteine-specific elongation factor